MDINLVQIHNVRQFRPRIPSDTLFQSDVPRRGMRALLALIIVAVHNLREGNGDEDAGAAEAHHPVAGHGPPVFGQAANVEILGMIEGSECGEEGGHGKEEGVIVEEAKPLRFGLVAVVEHYAEEGEVALGVGVVFLQRMD